MTGIFVLSVDTEDPIEPRSGHARWNAGDRRLDAWREATRRFMRLLDGHAMSATWVVGEAAILEAWGRRRMDSADPGNSLVGTVTGMATRQEIAVSPSRASASGPNDGARGSDAGLVRCAQFAEWKENGVRTLALPTGEVIDVEPYAAVGFTACCRMPTATRPSPLTDDLFQRPLPMWRPSDLDLVGPILMVPVSVTIASLDNHRRLVPEAVRIARIRKGLDQAASEGTLVHLALRLADLDHSETLFRTVEDILLDVAEARAGVALRVATVAELRRVYDAEAGGTAPRRAA